MNEFTPLTRPLQSTVAIDPTPKDSLADGFNYPSFRLINKQARVALSPHPLSLQQSNSYRLFAAANSKGWFAAVKSDGASALIFSPLHELRSAFKHVNEHPDDVLTPQRILSIPLGKPNIIAFACNDTRLLVGLEQGHVIVYDTKKLFSPGSDEITPLHGFQNETSGPTRQIVPNPGTEPNLVDLVAIVRGDGVVQLLNMQMQSQGGWAAGDADSTPVTVSWSPKGKHIAIGLRTGDILTFALTNTASPHKHIPRTAEGILVSLNWLGPGHTFRTSYAPSISNTSNATQHVITMDIKTSTATYVNLSHPFPSPDRSNQDSLLLVLPKWDEDPPPSTEAKALIIVGDTSSVDLEVVANAGGRWYQQSQENPLTLPLDKNLEETMLLGLDVDLTDSSGGAPIMYAYLNDGTLQGWFMEHPKPYIGMVSTIASVASQSSAPVQQQTSSAFGSQAGFASFAQQLPSGFAQVSTGFGLQSGSAFGQSSTFNQSSTSAFGQSSPSPAFGQTTGFGSLNQPTSTSTFGQSSQSPSPSAFGSSPPMNQASGFGGGSGGAFGGGSTANAFGTPNTFGGFGGSTGSSNAFGQTGFGFGAASLPATMSTDTLAAPEMTREASMSDSTTPSALSGLSLGGSNSDSKPTSTGGIFGSFSAPSSSNQSSSNNLNFGGIVKPASGFGAFSNFQSVPVTEQPKSNSFSGVVSSTPSSGFGQSGFGQSGFAKPSFGQSGFGQPAFGKPSVPPPTTTSSGGFGAFASGNSSFGAASFTSAVPSVASTTPAPTSGGFGSFASGAPSAFGTGPPKSGDFSTLGSQPSQAQSSNDRSFSTFGNSSSSSVFGGGSAATNSVFGGTSAFKGSDNAESKKDTPATTFATPVSKPSIVSSPPSSPESSIPAKTPSSFTNNNPLTPSTPSAFKSSTAGPTSGAFGSLTASSSGFRPAVGFGAFGSDATPTSSPFLKNTEVKSPPVSAFGSMSSTPPSSTTPAGTPTFGATSMLGGVKSAFAPPTPQTPTPAKTTIPTSGGFSAFSGTSGSFGMASTPKKSFGDLLKTGDNNAKDPVKPGPSVFSTPPKEAEAKETSTSAEVKPKIPVSVFSTPSKAPVSVFASITPSPTVFDKHKIPAPVFSPPPRDEPPSGLADLEKSKSKETDNSNSGTTPTPTKNPEEPSLSAASSFVEISEAERSGEDSFDDDGEAELERPEDDADDNKSFFSESFGSESDELPAEEEEEEVDGEPYSSSRSASPEPTSIPLSESRSPSATPQPEASTIRATPSPPAVDNLDSSQPLPSIKEESTTPPGSPERSEVPTKPPVSASAPSTSPTTSTPFGFGFGLGRPSTRPARSSPLAGIPVSNADNASPEKASPLKLPASPKPRPGVLSAPIKTEPEDDAKPLSSKPARPQTPPLLSAFGNVKPVSTPSTPILAPTTTPPLKFSDTPTITPPPSLFGNLPPPSPFSLGGKTPVEPITGTRSAAPSPPSQGYFGSRPSELPPTPKAGEGEQGVSKLSGLFGGPSASAPGSTSVTPSASSSTPSGVGLGISPFALKPAASSAPALSTKSFFGNMTPPSPASTPSTPPLPTKSFFGNMTPAAPTPSTSALPTKSFFGSMTPPSPKPASAQPGMASFMQVPPKPMAPVQPPEFTMEEGMQKECAILFTGLNRELEDLRLLAQEANRRRTELGKSAGGSRRKVDLGEPAKWGLTDTILFGQTMQQYQQDLVELKENRDAKLQTLKELQNSMLKANTKKEEIARFNRAKGDAEFAKMLKMRTLGPEHLETQTQLRRSIRAMRDRIQKLEDHLQSSKKRLAQMNSGKVGLRAPSLDTINRTYRNIDIAIQQQTDDVAKLSSRLAKLNVSTPMASPKVDRDARLPDSVSKRPYNVTPHVAITTAAALNAERSAQKLKRALLAVRKEPLLNKKAAAAPPAPVTFSTPLKATTPGGFGFGTPISGPLYSPNSTPQASTPDWTLPDDNFNPSPLPSVRRGASIGGKKHNSVPLKRSPGMATSPPATAAFDWGPLPTYNQTPVSKLTTPVSLATPPRIVPVSPGNVLSGSWASEGFGKKV